MRNLRKNRKGFTLIEIIVVLVIMGILLAIAVPAIMGYVSKANDAKYLSQARGGYLAAQTIVARDAADKATGGTAITAESINKELEIDKAAAGSGKVVAIDCKRTGVTKLDGCNVKVEGMGTKYVRFEADKKAEVVNGEKAEAKDEIESYE